MIKGALMAALLAVSSATTTPSLFSISNVWDNPYTQFISGLAYGGMNRMIFFEPNQNCMSKMFMVGNSVLTLTRLNRERSTTDWLVGIPLKIYKLVDSAIDAFNMCAASDPNLN